MKLVTGTKMLWDALINHNAFAMYQLSEKIIKFLNPNSIISEFGRTFLKDEKFKEYYRKFEPDNWRSYDRKYFLDQLAGSVVDVAGDTAECGVYMGASSWLICNQIRGYKKTHHIFDSFEGLSKPDEFDGEYWQKGDMSVDIRKVNEVLSNFDFVEYHKGWIPERFADVDDNKFSFIHIDVDLYEPTRDSIEFFYERMNKNGILLCDDYGFESCPGATRAMDEFFKNKHEKIINVPTGQAFIIKR